MKTFKINEKYEIGCWYEKTRYGFRHLANLYRTGLSGTTVLIEKTKVCYYNRTWESFEFETVISDLLKKAEIMTIEEQKTYLELLRKNNLEEINKQFSFIGMVANIGNILYPEKTEQNSFKKRMLSAGLPELDFPENWNELTEEEKENRLNNVINHLSKNL